MFIISGKDLVRFYQVVGGDFFHLGLISFICCFWECANILNQQTISWFEMARNNNIRYSPGPCIYLGLLYSLIQITVALFKAVLDCKEKRYIEGDYV